MSEQTVKNTKKSFISGVALLAASAVAVKLIGVFYKIPLVNMIGIEGMAYFLAAYHVYTVLFMISSAGLPVAVSILVSKRRAMGDFGGAEEVFRCSVKLFSFIGAVCTAVMWFGADAIAAAIKIPQAAPSLRAIAPSLLFVCVSSAMRGYFQGLGIMYPTGVSQIIESAGKLCLGLIFAFFALERGEHLFTVSACAVAGISVGSALSMLYLVAEKLKKRPSFGKAAKKTRGILREILSVAAPITLGAAVISLTGAVDTALISSRLQASGLDSTLANTVYSSYGNLAIPLYNLVPSLISPIAVAMAPILADAYAKGDRERERGILSSAVKLCALISLPAALGIAAFSEPILALLYPTQTDAVSLAAPLLSAVSPAIFFSCLISVSNSALQAYGRARLPIVSMALGAAIKIVLEYFLLGFGAVNIFGAPVSTLCCNFAVALLNIFFIEKYSCKTGGVTHSLVSPLFAAASATVIAVLAYFGLARLFDSATVRLLFAIAVDAVSYLLIAAFNGSIEEEDLSLFPSGEKIIKIMKKLRLLRNDNEKRRKNNFIEG